MAKSVSERWGVRRCSADAADGVERELAAWKKAEALVERDGCGVIGSDVEVGALAGGVVEVEHVSEKRGGVAPAAMVGVGAEAGDFTEVGGGGADVHALAAHGDEVAGVTDAEVRAHLAGADAEEAGEGDVGEGDHLGGVGAGDGLDGEVVWDGWERGVGGEFELADGVGAAGGDAG